MVGYLDGFAAEKTSWRGISRYISRYSDDINERINYDANQMLQIMEYLEIIETKIVKLSRIGKHKENYQESPRPIIVRFETAGHKWNILRRGKYLRDSVDFFAVYFAKDMNKEEMEKDKKLRNELISLRKTGAEVVIKNGEIIGKRKSRLSIEEEEGYMSNHRQTYQSHQMINNRR